MQGKPLGLRQKSRWMLAAAVAGVLVGLSGTANAQFAVQQDGGANDANNRVGSGGRNTGGPGRGIGVTANQIANGNVTNGKEFRGTTNIGDARAFRGTTSDLNSDRFIRDSSGGFDNKSLAEIYTTRPYYGESRAVAAPAGYIPPVTTLGTGQRATFSAYNPTAVTGSNLGSLSTGEGLVPRLGTTTTLLGGNVDPLTGNGQIGVAMSPLSGIRTVGPDQGIGYNSPGLQPSTTGGDRFRTGNDTVDKMRSEIEGTRGPTNPNQPATPGKGTTPAAPVPGTVGGQTLNRPVGPAIDSPTNPSLGGSAPLGQPVVNGISTGQSTQPQAPVSSQQSELERRYQESQGQAGQPKTDQQINQDLRNLKPTKPPAVPGVPTVPGNPVPAVPAPGAPANPAAPGAPAAPVPSIPTPIVPESSNKPARTEPMVIKSMADGVSSPTLADVLRKAEAAIKKGDYRDAIQQYTLAEAGAPNTPLLLVGQANAELGQEAFKTAEAHLRQSFDSHPELLLARYDLPNLLTQARFDKVVKDLKDLSAQEQKDPTAPFLLAYLSYNAGNTQEAGTFLDEVVRRENNLPDQLIPKIRSAWGLSGGLNK